MWEDAEEKMKRRKANQGGKKEGREIENRGGRGKGEKG